MGDESTEPGKAAVSVPLRSSCFSTNLRIAGGALLTGAVAGVNDLHHAFAGDFEGVGVEVDEVALLGLGSAEDAALEVLNLFDDVEAGEDLSVADGGHALGDLKGGGLEFSLADRVVGDLSLGKFASELLDSPFVAGDEARFLVVKLVGGARAESTAACGGEEGVTHHDASLVKEDVVGAGKGFSDVDFSVGIFGVVTEYFFTDAELGGAVDVGVFTKGSDGHAGGGYDGFEA